MKAVRVAKVNRAAAAERSTRRALAEGLARTVLEVLGDDPEALALVADLVALMAHRSPIRRRAL